MSVNALAASIARKIWTLFVICLMLLAVYVSVGRIIMPRLEIYQSQIENALSKTLGLQVTAQQLQGGWQGFYPVASLRQVRFDLPGSDKSAADQQPVVEIEQLVLQLDVLSSLLSRQVVFSSFALQGMNLELHEDEAGRWRIPGLPENEKGRRVNPLRWLLLQKQMLLSDISLTLRPANSAPKQLQIPSWGLRCGLMVCSSQGRVILQPDSADALQFSLNIYERPGDQDFRLQGYLATAPLQLTEWLPLLQTDNSLINDVQGLRLGGEVWFDWRDGQLLDARGTLNAPQIELGRHHEAMAAVEFLHSDFTWLRNTGKENELWGLWLTDLTFKWGGRVFEPAQRRLSLLQQPQGKMARLVADRVALEPIVSTLLALDSLPDKLREPLATLRPTGQLHNLHLDYRLPNTDKPDSKPWIKVETLLENVALSPWHHVPGGSGISGYLELTPEAGLVDFVSDDFTLHFPRLYSDHWQFQQARGVVNWVREGHRLWLNGQNLRLVGAVGKVSGRFASFISTSRTSNDTIEPRLSLLIGLENSRLPDAQIFVPDLVASPTLVKWLDQAFADGQVSSIRFVLDQSLKKGVDKASNTLALDVDATAVDFSFHPDWPHLREADVGVQVRGQQVSVQATKARFFELDLHNIEAQYGSKRGAARLTATADVNGPLRDAWRTLTDTPLRKNLFELGRDFKFSGPMTGKLALDLPFASPNQSDVKLAFKTRDAGLEIPSIGVAANTIVGDFNYTTKKGLNAARVTASMFGSPARLSINSKNSAAGLATELLLQGHLNSKDLARWVPDTVLSRLEGETDFQAELAVGKGSKNRLLINTDLKGVAVQLPEPLAKTADQTSNFSFNLALAEPQIHQLRYGDIFSYALRFSEQGYQDGQIQLGSASSQYRAGSGIQVRGDLPLLDYQQWLDEVKATPQAGDKNADSTAANDSLISRITDVQLQVGTFRLLDKNYRQVTFNAQQQKGDWRINFDTRVAQGELNYFSDLSKPLAVAFEYLYLPDDTPAAEVGQAEAELKDVEPQEIEQQQLEAASAARKPALAAGTDVLAGVIPQDLPALDISVNKLYLGEQPFGRWAFNLRPYSDGARLQALNVELRGIQARGELDWLQQQGHHSSYFSGDVLIPDLAAMLEAWGKAPAITGENAKLKGQLNWQGSPAQFSLLNVQGPVSLKAKRGRIVDMQSIRLLGVLNFNALSRRLRFDFSDLFKKGFSFDRVEGKLQFDKGDMLISESLIIDGPSAKFKIDGRTDLVNERFDQDVIVVLPVTDNLPVIMSLAGFPQVGVPIYLFNRAFGDVLDRFSSVNYRVTGSWDDPKVVLSSFFDSQNLPQSKTPAKKRRLKK